MKVYGKENEKWKERFVERLEHKEKKYFWLTGEFQNQDKGKDTDVWALEHQYASVVPLQYDLTDYELLKSIQL